MKTKTVWQADKNNVLLYETVAHELRYAPGMYNVPNRAYEDEPTPAPPGYVNQHIGNAWVHVEDHRQTTFYFEKEAATEDEPALIAEYQLETEVQVAGETVSYNGLGPVPAWLTDIAPPPAEPPQPLIE